MTTTNHTALQGDSTFGLPYAPAGVDNGQATATCPACGHVSKGQGPKTAARAYADHYVDAMAQEATEAEGLTYEQVYETQAAGA